MKIIVINGLPRSGKDLFCDYAKVSSSLIYPMSTIDEVKKLAKLLGWNGEKDEKGRKFLSDLKDAMSAYNDLPRKYVLEQIQKQCFILSSNHLMGDYNAIFLVQAREPKEIERWEKENGAKSLLIYRKDVDKEWGNHSDDDTWKHDYDYHLINNGTKNDWAKTTRDFINMIKEERWQSHI